MIILLYTQIISIQGDNGIVIIMCHEKIEKRIRLIIGKSNILTNIKLKTRHIKCTGLVDYETTN
jgi:hypothetical protein